MVEPGGSRAEITVREAESAEEIRAILAIRRAVFVVEQGVTTNVSGDPYDQFATHVIGVVNGQIVGAGRLHITGHEAQIAWVAVLRAYRHLGIGRRIMAHLIELADRAGVHVIVLNAQTHALRFYQHLGFEPVGDTFIMGGIPHQMMARHAPAS